MNSSIVHSRNGHPPKQTFNGSMNSCTHIGNQNKSNIFGVLPTFFELPKGMKPGQERPKCTFWKYTIWQPRVTQNLHWENSQKDSNETYFPFPEIQGADINVFCRVVSFCFCFSFFPCWISEWCIYVTFQQWVFILAQCSTQNLSVLVGFTQRGHQLCLKLSSRAGTAWAFGATLWKFCEAEDAFKLYHHVGARYWTINIKKKNERKKIYIYIYIISPFHPIPNYSRYKENISQLLKLTLQHSNY